MKSLTYPSTRGSVRSAAAVFVSFALVVSVAGKAQAVAVAVPLGAADSFVVLAGTGVTNTGPTTLNGDIGTYPTTTITNTGTLTVNGVNHGGDLVTQQAKTDLTAAYLNADAQSPIDGTISADLAGQTLTPGIYAQAGTMNLNGTLILDAGGNPDAVWLFQAGSDLVVGSGSAVTLTGGAQACNVFWQVTSSASINTGVSFQGTIMALTSITIATGSTIYGRALARNGTVTLDTDTITRMPCAAAPIGPIDTGDGSSSQAAGNSTLYLMTAAALATGVGATGILVTRRRRDGST